MKRLLDIIILAIATVAGYKNTISTQAEEIRRLNDENAKLAGDDAADKAAVQEAKDRAQAIEDAAAEANTKAEELATALEEHPNTPTVDANFAITEQGDAVEGETGGGGEGAGSNG